MKEIPLDQLSAGRFAGLVGAEFNVVAGDEPGVSLKLTAVTTPRVAEAGARDSRYESFSLLFEGPADRPLAQGIHAFEHECLGRAELFLVPVGNEHGCLQYQVVFNRLRAAE